MDKSPIDVIVSIGAGSIGLAIARRVGAGKHILLSDIDETNLKRAEKTLSDAGFAVSVALVDISSPESIQGLIEKALELGFIKGLILAAGISPSQAPIHEILKTDLYGTALVLEAFGKIVSNGSAGIVISSQSGHRLPALSSDQNKALALTPASNLLALEFLDPTQISDSLHAYQISKRANSLRVMAEAVRWGKKGARLNAISPGIIITPLAIDELNGPRGDFYKKMIDASPAGRAGTPDEVAHVAALLMSDNGSFITGSDILMDGGTTAAYWFDNNVKQ